MRQLILLIFFFSFLSNSYAQKKLSVYKTFGGVVYEMDSLTVSPKQVKMLLKQNPEAYAEFKVAKRKASISSILGFTGGLLIGLPLGEAIAGSNPEWIYAGGGALLLVGSIPFSISFRGHAMNAIDLYNSHLPTSSVKIKPSLYFCGTGVSLVIRF
jgi:hypothetical protein